MALYDKIEFRTNKNGPPPHLHVIFNEAVKFIAHSVCNYRLLSLSTNCKSSSFLSGLSPIILSNLVTKSVDFIDVTLAIEDVI